MKPIVKTMIILCIGASALVLAACNTTKGFGKDVEKAGSSLKDSAEKNGAD